MDRRKIIENFTYMAHGVPFKNIDWNCGPAELADVFRQAAEALEKHPDEKPPAEPQ